MLTWVKPQRLSWNCEEVIETKHINQPDADDQPSEVLTNIVYTGQIDGEQNSCDQIGQRGLLQPRKLHQGNIIPNSKTLQHVA